MERGGLWVFGYGSLCWKPGFEFKRVLKGFIKGYARVFWQGNETHRGTKGKVPTYCLLQTSTAVSLAFAESSSIASK